MGDEAHWRIDEVEVAMATTATRKMSPDEGGRDQLPSGAAPSKRKRVYLRKTDVVLEAAGRVFLRSGFAATSMDEIAAEAQVSKRTVYSNFGSKAELFAQVIRKQCLQNIPSEDKIKEAGVAGPADGLLSLAIDFLGGIFRKDQIELYQTVVAAVRRHPDAGRVFYDGPITASEEMFASYLDSQVAAGTLALIDTGLAASQLIALLKTNVHMKLLLGRPVRLTKKMITDSAAASIDLFLNGALPR